MTAGVTVEGTNRVIIIYNYLAIWFWVWGGAAGVARTDFLAVSLGEGGGVGGVMGDGGWRREVERAGVIYRGFGS